MDRTICDRCNNYYVHPSGVYDRCHASLIVANRMDLFYINDRMNGNKNHCKCFQKLDKEVGAK